MGNWQNTIGNRKWAISKEQIAYCSLSITQCSANKKAAPGCYQFEKTTRKIYLKGSENFASVATV